MRGLRFFCKFLSIIVITLLFTNCSGSDGDGGENPNLPSNLVVNTEIVGTNASNPNGDGSGVVNFTVSADNATSYKILIGTDVINTTTGLASYTFTQSGTNTYTVYVSAYNGSQFISTTKVIIVYVTMTMAWGDEFSNGQLDSSKWTYETGAGGWGNNELQYYTNRPENLVVENGSLKIKLIKELYNGSNYTSARIVTKNKYQFQYGRVDIRAKLPAGGGTWPALWMLGSDINTSPWPACGEIDIMEHVGNNLNRILGTVHHPGHSGGNADGGNVLISNATTEFHIYSCEWSASTIKFYVDNALFYTFNNNANLPFNKPFFFIFNCAMGGNLGGAVDPNFTSATFEIDYVHVYH